MADITYAPVEPSNVWARTKAALAAIGNRIVEARMREAQRQVAYQLLAFDDATLNDLGFDRAELKQMDPAPRAY